MEDLISAIFLTYDFLTLFEFLNLFFERRKRENIVTKKKKTLYRKKFEFFSRN